MTIPKVQPMLPLPLRFLTICACLLISPLATAVGPHGADPATLAAGAVWTDVEGPQLAQGMMGPGMMGRNGMMGPGYYRGGRYGSGNPSSATGSDVLSGYVSAHGLACFSCHGTSTSGVGPSFDAIARRYAGQPGAASLLARAITGGVSGRWAGYGPMPPGQASPAQANRLARLILGRGR